MSVNVVERAFEIAGSGHCASVEELRRLLKQEGHGSAAAHLASPSLRKQLAALIRQADASISR